MRPHESWFAPDGEGAEVPGFLTAASAEIIAALLSWQLDREVAGSLAEIGTYQGRTFIGLVKAAREGERVVGFDLFPPEVEEGFRAAMARLDPAQQGQVVAVRKDMRDVRTTDWVGTLGTPARFVHIDGGHSREAILNDLQLATSYLAARALVVLDDFMHDWYPDLTEGIIDGLRASRALVPVALVPRLGLPQEGGSKLVCASRDGAPEYQGFLFERFGDRRPGMRQLAGNAVLTFQGF